MGESIVSVEERMFMQRMSDANDYRLEPLKESLFVLMR